MISIFFSLTVIQMYNAMLSRCKISMAAYLLADRRIESDEHNKCKNDGFEIDMAIAAPKQ